MNEKMIKLAEELDCYLRENHIFAEVGFDGVAIEAEISWGDWKHEHLRCDFLAEEFFKKKGVMLISILDETTEEDGSDCYSALHRYLVRA